MLEIRMFGEFSIKNDDSDISAIVNRSKRLRALFAYLITNYGREVSQDELIEVLWPNEEVDNPANTLKTILHRARAALSALGLEKAQSYISYQRGAYAWTPAAECFTDIHEFERLCKEAEREPENTEKRAELFMDAANLFKGDFLPKNSMDHWVVPLAGYYKTKFALAIREASDYLQGNGRFGEIVPLCQKGAHIDPYEEYFHQTLIRALVASGRQQQAMEHYDYVNALFFNKFGVNPSAELTALYREVVKTSKKTELNLKIIIEDLREQSLDSGCFYCDYEPFRTVYRLEARSAARSGQAVYICLLTISDAHGDRPKLSTLSKAMDKLFSKITQSLRYGDLFTRYSVNQYLIMLPSISFELSEMVIRRITEGFRRENPKLSVMLGYTLHPIVPVEIDAETQGTAARFE